MSQVILLIRNICCVVIAVGLLVLVGWQFDIPFLIYIGTDFLGMNPFAALSLISVATWQLLYLRHERLKERSVWVIMYCLAIFVSLVGSLRLVDLSLGTSYAFDDLLYPSQLQRSFMSLPAALSFTLLSVAMLLVPLVNRKHDLILLFASPVFVVSLISLFGYFIGDNSTLMMRPFRPMALHTTLCFFLLSGTFAFLFSNNIFSRTLLSADLGGFIARKLIPYILFVPMVLGFLCFQGQRLGLYDAGFGVAIIVVGAVFSFVALVVWHSRQLSMMDHRRKAAMHQARQHAQKVGSSNRELAQRTKQLAQRTEELEQRTEELVERTTELEQFITVSNHDLQEPLRKIIMFANMVKSDYDNLSGASQATFDRVIAAATQMRDVLKDVVTLTDLSKTENFIAVNLNEVLRAVELEMKETIQQKAAIIHADGLPEIKAVYSQMVQLFYHLLYNALKFSKEGQTPEIAIRCREVADVAFLNRYELNSSIPYYEFSVADNGIGFEQANATKIFTMFQQLHNREEYPGTGIGLTICKKIVQNHNGTICAESSPGEGATFKIFLPIDPENGQ